MFRLPVIFVSHGSPTTLTDPSAARDFFTTLPDLLPTRPRAILVVSAHFVERVPTVTASPRPSTMHDFYGFSGYLSSIRYPAAGDPALADRIATLLAAAGIDAATDDTRGLDHGVWVPLALAYPLADIPVVELAITTDLDPARQLAIGRALTSLRDEGVLIIGSGSATHNLSDLDWSQPDGPPAAWAHAFDEWLDARIVANDIDALLDFADRAPHAAHAHPVADHLMPLFTALGAADGIAGRRIHGSFAFTTLSMSAWMWE